MALRTPLYPWHERAGAKLFEFGGWEMPLQYAGIVEEHLAVRSAAGLFDVSHMGKLIVDGPGAAAGLERLSTNGLPAKPGRGRYTHLLDANGAIIDDVIVTRLEPDRILVVCNAGPRRRVVEWIRSHVRDATVTDATEAMLCLALQGPRAAAILRQLTSADLSTIRPFGATWIELSAIRPGATTVRVPPETEGRGPPRGPSGPSPSETMAGPVELGLITRTGYTGEDGFEIFPSADRGVDVWTALLDAGRPRGLVPAGLGARDTLRLEKGYLLSGQDFTGRETSLEASCDWLVQWDHDFVGREALLRQWDAGTYRRLQGIRMLDRGIPRPGCTVARGTDEVGVVTSGTFSPSLRYGIALAYLEPRAAVPGTHVDVSIRGAMHPAEVVRPPFL